MSKSIDAAEKSVALSGRQFRAILDHETIPMCGFHSTAQKAFFQPRSSKATPKLHCASQKGMEVVTLKTDGKQTRPRKRVGAMQMGKMVEREIDRVLGRRKIKIKKYENTSKLSTHARNFVSVVQRLHGAIISRKQVRVHCVKAKLATAIDYVGWCERTREIIFYELKTGFSGRMFGPLGGGHMRGPLAHVPDTHANRAVLQGLVGRELLLRSVRLPKDVRAVRVYVVFSNANAGAVCVTAHTHPIAKCMGEVMRHIERTNETRGGRASAFHGVVQSQGARRRRTKRSKEMRAFATGVC